VLSGEIEGEVEKRREKKRVEGKRREEKMCISLRYS
jgi:hypothetical protein